MFSIPSSQLHHPLINLSPNPSLPRQTQRSKLIQSPQNLPTFPELH
ncbi:hypothetical protein H6F42_10995 [Pseudanabaena sp. FACHB-1998]|nr:hypothetical protein [Pseudanabaena sp. FACHB-1998]